MGKSHKKIVPRKYTDEKLTKESYLRILKLEGEDEYESTPYKTLRGEVIITHKKCGRIFKSTPERMITSGERCICEKQEAFYKEVEDHYGFQPYEYLTDFDKYTSPIVVKCKKCGEIKEYKKAFNILGTDRSHMYDMPPCTNCYKRERRKFKPEIEERVKEVCDGNEFYDVLTESLTDLNKDKIHLRCKKCGHSFLVGLSNLKAGYNRNAKLGYYCPNCNKMVRDNRSYEERLKDSNQNIIALEPYAGREVKIAHKCLVCGYIWNATPNNRLNGEGCPRCSHIYPQSKMELELRDYIKSFYNGPMICNDRKILNGKELDIYLPKLKLAIEVDGVYWHSDRYKPDDYHLNKTEECEKQGIRLLHIFSSEYHTKKEIVLDKIRYTMGYSNKPKIYARKCYIDEITSQERNEFLDENHIQGKDNASIRLGLFCPMEDGDHLVSVMTFCKPRKSLGQNAKTSKYDYELSRFASDINYIVEGAFSKLFSYFKKNYEWSAIITYADRRWSKGNVYNSSGFEFDHFSKPNYWYFYGEDEYEIFHRFRFRKNRLKELFPKIYSDDKTEKQIMQEANYGRVYDCGNYVFKCLKKDENIN